MKQNVSYAFGHVCLPKVLRCEGVGWLSDAVAEILNFPSRNQIEPAMHPKIKIDKVELGSAFANLQVATNFGNGHAWIMDRPPVRWMGAHTRDAVGLRPDREEEEGLDQASNPTETEARIMWLEGDRPGIRKKERKEGRKEGRKEKKSSGRGAGQSGWREYFSRAVTDNILTSPSVRPVAHIPRERNPERWEKGMKGN